MPSEESRYCRSRCVRVATRGAYVQWSKLFSPASTVSFFSDSAPASTWPLVKLGKASFSPSSSPPGETALGEASWAGGCFCFCFCSEPELEPWGLRFMGDGPDSRLHVFNSVPRRRSDVRLGNGQAAVTWTRVESIGRWCRETALDCRRGSDRKEGNADLIIDKDRKRSRPRHEYSECCQVGGAVQAKSEQCEFEVGGKQVRIGEVR